MKNMKIAHFIGYFLAIYGWMWQTKIILWQSAWKNEENVHLRFFVFQTSLHRSLQNKLRDFQRWWIYEKYENCPFYRLFFGHIWLDMTNKKFFYDNQHGKMKKIHVSDFLFWKLCHRDLCSTYWEIFEKHQFMKNTKIKNFIEHFSNRSS